MSTEQASGSVRRKATHPGHYLQSVSDWTTPSPDCAGPCWPAKDFAPHNAAPSDIPFAVEDGTFIVAFRSAKAAHFRGAKGDNRYRERYSAHRTGQKPTSNGVVTERDIADIAEQIRRVYEQADYVGSLVVGGPSDRPTQHSGPHDEPPGWWDDFWKRHFVNTGRNREETIEILKRLLGENWRAASQDDAEQAMDESQQKHD